MTLERRSGLSRVGVAGVVAATAAAVCLVAPTSAAQPSAARVTGPERSWPARIGSSPRVDPRAPFTPTVLRLLHQLEPAQPDPQHDATPAVGTTVAQLMNADLLLHGTEGATSTTPCTGVGSVVAPKGTTPAIAPLCWTDALGVAPGSGAQKRRTTAPPIRLSMAASFNSDVTNAWGQVEGSEARQLGITGIYAPQMDITRFPDWGRNDPTFGEDPLLDGVMGASEINGVQSRGAMAQVKHFAFYNGVLFQGLNVQVQDQAAHQLYLTPFEYATTGSSTLPHPGRASSMMCSYQRYQVVSAPHVTGTPAGALGPAGGNLACDNQVMNYVTRDQWGYQGFIASDYRLGMDSGSKSILAGNDQEMPDSVFFGSQLVADVVAGHVPLYVFNRSIARVLYQEERFHLMGHAHADSDYLSHSNPSEADGKYALTSTQRHRDAAVVERAAEQGAVLLKNRATTLPLSRGDLRHGVLVVGENAEYMPASPGVERAPGFPDREAISPLQQLRAEAPSGSHITYLAGLPDPTSSDGNVVPGRLLSIDGTHQGTGLRRTSGPGAPATDRQIDFTSVSGHGHLRAGRSYTWTGYVDVPTRDTYTFHFQFSVPDVMPGASSLVATPSACDVGAPTFALATASGRGQPTARQSLSASAPTLLGTASDPTMAGNTERGLANCYVTVGALTPGVHALTLTWAAPASLGTDAFHLRAAGRPEPSLRFAYSRASGDLRDLATAARAARKVVVFAEAPTSSNVAGNLGALGTDTVTPFDDATNKIIDVAAAANPRVAVVTNVAVPTLTPWIHRVGALLQLWFPGQEGGTATARLLLGRANPSGHLPLTWPAASTDTISQYDETRKLYPGDTLGTHPDRFRVATGGNLKYDEGLFVGYRFFDRQHLRPQFPFGWGLSYTHFSLSGLHVRRSGGGLDVSFAVTNDGRRSGSLVPQVYVGAAPHVPVGVQQADRALAGWTRLTLRPGQTKRSVIHLGPGRDRVGHGDRRAFQYWNSPTQSWRTATGCRTISVGTSDGLPRLELTTRAGVGVPASRC